MLRRPRRRWSRTSTSLCDRIWCKRRHESPRAHWLGGWYCVVPERESEASVLSRVVIVLRVARCRACCVGAGLAA